MQIGGGGRETSFICQLVSMFFLNLQEPEKDKGKNNAELEPWRARAADAGTS